MFESDGLGIIDGIRGYYEDDSTAYAISSYLKHHSDEKNVILCIGTDRYIGDCLGPIVGTFLSKLEIWCPIYGTLENPVHAINLRKNISEIKLKYPNHSIIAVDACLGTKDCIGIIQAKSEPLYPGKGVGKKLPSVGDISIVGIVDSIESDNPKAKHKSSGIGDEYEYEYYDIFPLHNIRLNFVMKMAETITKGLYEAFKIQKKFQGTNL